MPTIGVSWIDMPARVHSPHPSHRAALRRRRRRRSVFTTVVLAVAMIIAAGMTAPSLTDRTHRLPFVLGAVPYWDAEDALDSLTSHDDVVRTASPWWFGVGADGSVLSLPTGGAVDLAPLERLAARGTRVVPTVADVTGTAWTPEIVSALLRDPQRRATHIASLAALAARTGFAGLQIDYEDLQASDRDAFSAFVVELSTALHAQGDVLSVTVHPKTTDAGYDGRNQAQDYAVIGRAADHVVVMAYDWHWAAGDPGPIAPTSWVADVLTYTTGLIPPEKVILGIALYGYDWVGRAGTPLVWQQVQALATLPGVRPARDDASGSSWFRYVRDGAPHEVWYEDAASVTQKLDLAVRFRLGGIALWRLGSEDPGIWAALRDRAAP